MKNFEVEIQNNNTNTENDRIPLKQKQTLSETDKKYILGTICLMVFLDFTGYGLPITLYPQIALERGWTPSYTGYIFGLFPFGGFFTS